MTFAGLRIGEALALRWSEVDLAGGRLRLLDSKTAAGVRVIDLVPALREELVGLKLRSGPTDPREFVFATRNGTAQSASNIRNRVLAKTVVRANARLAERGLAQLPDGLTPNSLRRTYASLLLAKGDEVPFVMQLLGHANPSVTLGVYAQVMFRGEGERERLRARRG